ncbi:MAG: type II toxin-antitoxin system RelE/ParE family toxin [Planctomycetaceae bacterium]|nr:type II toxin-antitoxin system RelE/ParE family toxin [Planctomycetaceae bacterium]
MPSIRFLPGAEEDYSDALAWFIDHNPVQGDRFEAAIELALEDISAFPKRWPLRDEQTRMRPITGFPYVIYYREMSDLVVVVAVAHTSRNPAYWESRNLEDPSEPDAS